MSSAKTRCDLECLKALSSFLTMFVCYSRGALNAIQSPYTHCPIIAERLSARQLIVQCSHVTSVPIYTCIYIYISVTLTFPSHFNCVGAVSEVLFPDYWCVFWRCVTIVSFRISRVWYRRPDWPARLGTGYQRRGLSRYAVCLKLNCMHCVKHSHV